jgi:hypothetical protein
MELYSHIIWSYTVVDKQWWSYIIDYSMVELYYGRVIQWSYIVVNYTVHMVVKLYSSYGVIQSFQVK